MNKKILMLGVSLVSSVWCGWHMTEELAETAITDAKQHPLASSCVEIAGGGLRGTGVFVQEDVVATAGHLLPSDSRRNVQRSGHFESCKLPSHTIHAEARLENETRPYFVKRAYVHDQADVAFLVLDDGSPKPHAVAPVMDEMAYRTSIVRQFELDNSPRISGDGFKGVDVNYIGCGHSLVPEPTMDRTCLASLQSTVSSTVIGSASFRLGRLKLSQYFPLHDFGGGETFYGWTSLDRLGEKQGGDASTIYSSALKGDSGAPVFTVGENPQLFGVTSMAHVSDFFTDESVVGTQFSSLQGRVPGSKDTWWETFLRIRV